MNKLTTRASLTGLALIIAACGSDSDGDSDGAGGTSGTSGTSGAGTGGTAQGGTGGMTGGTGGTPQAGGGSGGAQGGGGSGGAQGGGGSGGTGGTGGTGGAGGAGGSGGQPPVDACTRSTWVASADPDHPLMYTPGDVPRQGIDGQAGTRWSSGLAQGTPATDEWYAVEFTSLVTISGLTLDTTGSAGDYPRAYTVEYSLDGTDFSSVLSEGGGALSGVGEVITVITFPEPVTLLAVRVTQTGAADPSWWSIHELTLSDCVEYTPVDGGVPDAAVPEPDAATPDASTPPSDASVDASAPPPDATVDAAAPDASLDGGDSGL